MERKLLFTNAQGISLSIGNIQIFEMKVQAVINAFLELELEDTQMTRDLLDKLIDKPTEAIKAIYKARIKPVDAETGLLVNVEQRLNNMVLPDLTKLKETCHILNTDAARHEYLSLFDISDTINLNEQRLELYLDRYRFYTDDEYALKLYNQLQQVVTIFNSINTESNFITSNNSIVTYDLGELVKINADQRLELKESGYKALLRKL
jgi:hypothetical protein